MSKVYSYVLRYDDGAAPNPFWDLCTLTICKPGIRKGASMGDWVVGTGSKRAKCNDGQVHDLSNHLVYAMKVTDKMSLAAYDDHCQEKASGKIPDAEHGDWRRRMGDCIYNYGQGGEPTIRAGVHGEGNRKTDLSGQNALLSKQFYYFGEAAVSLPTNLLPIVKQNQGYKIVEQPELGSRF